MAEQRDQYIIKAKAILFSDTNSQRDRFLRVENGMIRAISADMPEFPGDKIIDLSAFILSPLFCDYHLHFFMQAKSDAEAVGASLLRFGIGKAYEGGDKECFGVSLRDQQKGIPEVISSGTALYKRGGYGAAIGQGVETVEEAFTKINELQALSVDYIKIIHSGIFDPESGQITSGGFDAGELDRIVDHARSRGLDVYCHANGDQSVVEAVDAGVAAVIHGLHVSNSTLSAMAANKVAFIPTVNAFQSLSAVARSDRGLANTVKAVADHLAAVREAFELNVRILPGSDAGPHFLPYGSSYLAELRLFEKAGIPYGGIIRSASMKALQVDMPADFVVLDGLSVVSVFVGGELLS